MEKEKYNINFEPSKQEVIYRALREEIAHKTFMKRLREKHRQMENNIE
tara:strand:- start:837 stop:980 length:144 start_codon:yes stop_codon:yes gene_type:complete